MKPALHSPADAGRLLTELRGLIEQARTHVAQTANAAQTMLYWYVGQRIHKEVLREGRASYGEEIVSTLSAQLVAEYGQAFGLRSLRRMVQFAEAFPDERIVSPLATQLSWSHFIEILPLGQPQDSVRGFCRRCRQIWDERMAAHFLDVAIVATPSRQSAWLSS